MKKDIWPIFVFNSPVGLYTEEPMLEHVLDGRQNKISLLL